MKNDHLLYEIRTASKQTQPQWNREAQGGGSKNIIQPLAKVKEGYSAVTKVLKNTRQ